MTSLASYKRCSNFLAYWQKWLQPRLSGRLSTNPAVEKRVLEKLSENLIYLFKPNVSQENNYFIGCKNFKSIIIKTHNVKYFTPQHFSYHIGLSRYILIFGQFKFIKDNKDFHKKNNMIIKQSPHQTFIRFPRSTTRKRSVLENLSS